MGRTAVRRVNEWDGPSMLKVYAPYTGTHMAPEQEPPGLQEYVQRIDRYTYGLGWLLCEIDHQTVGFCHLSEDPSQPEDLFSVEFQLYVKQGLSRRHIGTALWQLMREMMEMGNRRRCFAGWTGKTRRPWVSSRPWGLSPWLGTLRKSRRKPGWCISWPPGPPRRQSPPSRTWWRRKITKLPGSGRQTWWISQGFKRWKPAAFAAGFLLLGKRGPRWW